MPDWAGSVRQTAVSPGPKSQSWGYSATTVITRPDFAAAHDGPGLPDHGVARIGVGDAQQAALFPGEGLQFRALGGGSRHGFFAHDVKTPA
jgi:hypothetical protein